MIQSPIRVLHVLSPTFGRRFSGHEVRWMRQFRMWNDSRIQHLLIDPDSRKVSNAVQYTHDNGERIKFKSIQMKRASRALWAIELLIILLRNKHSYDVLHVHSQIWGGLLCAPLSRFLRKSCVYEISLQGSDTPTALIHESNGHLKIKLFKLYDRILCTSKAAKDDCNTLGFSNGKSWLILNPVNAEQFQPPNNTSEKNQARVNLGIPAAAFEVLFVGSIKKRKGVDLLIEAFYGLAQSYDDLFLCVVGPTSSKESPGVDDDFVMEIKEKINIAGIQNRVRFSGLIDSDELMAAYYRATDLLVLPSRTEGFPNVLLEGMASGLPCIVSNLPGITDFLKIDGIKGTVIPQDDTDAIIEEIVRLRSDVQARNRMGRQARDYVVKNHNFIKWQNEMVSFYRNE